MVPYNLTYAFIRYLFNTEINGYWKDMSSHLMKISWQLQ